MQTLNNIWSFIVSPPAAIAGIVLLLGVLGYTKALTTFSARVITDFIKRYRNSNLPNLSAEIHLDTRKESDRGFPIQLVITRDRGTEFIYPEIEIQVSKGIEIDFNKNPIGVLKNRSLSYTVGVLELSEIPKLDDESYIKVEVECRVVLTRLICNSPVLNLKTAVDELMTL